MKDILDVGDKISSIVGAVVGSASLGVSIATLRRDREPAESDDGSQESTEQESAESAYILDPIERKLDALDSIERKLVAPATSWTLWVLTLFLALAYLTCIPGGDSLTDNIAKTSLVALQLISGIGAAIYLFDRRIIRIFLPISSFAGGVILPLFLMFRVLYPWVIAAS